MTEPCCNGNCGQGDCPHSRAVSRAVMRALLPGLAALAVVLLAVGSFVAIVTAGLLAPPSDLLGLLAAASGEPAFMAVALVLALLAGVAIGWCLSGQPQQPDEGLPPMRTADWQRIERESAQLVAAPGARRVRAGPLKPSYDARKQSVRPLHH